MPTGPSKFCKRRDFLRIGAAALPVAAMAQTPREQPIRFGLIGCGGRGTHDAGVLITEAGAQLVALADLFENKIAPSKLQLDKLLQQSGKPPVAANRLYQGPDAAVQLAKSDVDALLIAITPYFYPQVLEAVVPFGKHIYMEKPVAVDVAGCKKILELGKQFDGKIVYHVGLQVPWATAMQEMGKRIDQGAIGNIVTAQSFFYYGGGGRTPPQGINASEARIRFWSQDRVLSGDIVVEQNVHALDKINWILKGHPISAVARGGRGARQDYGDVWDHYVAEVTYPKNVVVSFQSTQFLKGWMDAGERFFGSRGTSESHYTGGVRIYGENAWDSGVNDILADAERNKFRAFVEDIRTHNFRNESSRGVESTLTAILVRTAAETGRETTWDSVANSNDRRDAHIDPRRL